MAGAAVGLAFGARLLVAARVFALPLVEIALLLVVRHRSLLIRRLQRPRAGIVSSDSGAKRAVHLASTSSTWQIFRTAHWGAAGPRKGVAPPSRRERDIDELSRLPMRMPGD